MSVANASEPTAILLIKIEAQRQKIEELRAENQRLLEIASVAAQTRTAQKLYFSHRGDQHWLEHAKAWEAKLDRLLAPPAQTSF